MTTVPHQHMESEAKTQVEHHFITKRLRIAGVLIVLGLVVEALSLIWNHPLSFLAFLGASGVLLFLGIVAYLTALVSPRQL